MTEQSTTPGSAVANGHTKRTDGNEFTFWRDHTTITLSPVAAPSILGLYGFAASTFMVAGNIAGWWGNATTSQLILMPFIFFFGGVAQFLAGMWSYRARDAMATAVHGMWGSFWMGYGLYLLLVAVGVLPSFAVSPVAAAGIGMWFVVLAALTWTATLAAAAQNIAIMSVLLTLAAGSTLLAIGLLAGGLPGVLIAGGWVLIASAVIAWYAGTAMMLEATYKRVVLPVGKIGREPNVPGRQPKETIQYQVGEPGVKAGQ